MFFLWIFFVYKYGIWQQTFNIKYKKYNLNVTFYIIKYWRYM